MGKVAGVQFRADIDKGTNIKKATEFIREAASKGANIVCLQELFNMVYPGYEQKEESFELAETIPGPTINQMSELANELAIVLIAPIYEKVLRGKYYNTAVLLGRDGWGGYHHPPRDGGEGITR